MAHRVSTAKNCRTILSVSNEYRCYDKKGIYWNLLKTFCLGYERVFRALYKIADTPFHIQGLGDDLHPRTQYCSAKSKGSICLFEK